MKVGNNAIGFAWLYYGAIILIVNLFVMPSVLIAYGRNSFFARLRSAAIYSLCSGFVFILLFAVPFTFRGSSGAEADIFFYTLFFLGLVSLFVTVAIQCSRMSGYCLRGKKDDQLQKLRTGFPTDKYEDAHSPKQVSPAESKIDPLSDEAESLAASRVNRTRETLDPSQRLARWLTLGLIGYAILANILTMVW